MPGLRKVFRDAMGRVHSLRVLSAAGMVSLKNFKMSVQALKEVRVWGPNVTALRKDPERFVPVSWDGDNETGFKVEIQVDAWDRHRLLEDLSRTFAEAGINIVEARCLVQHPMTRNRFVIEVGDTQALKAAINRLRAIDSVFDAYRVIPAGG